MIRSVSGAKRLTGRVAKASGRMRIVGSRLFAELDAKGDFAFDSLPPGKISLAYIEPAGVPLSRFNFRTVDSRDSIALPDLENSRTLPGCNFPMTSIIPIRDTAGLSRMPR